MTGNQFAAGSHGFSGTINNISRSEEQKLEALTEELLKALKDEKEIKGANPEEIADAVEHVKNEAKKEKVYKLSLNGILTGINMVMTNVTNISQNTGILYQQWHDYILTLFKLGS